MSTPLGFGEGGRGLEPGGELRGRAAQRRLGVEAEPPRDADDREKHVAELLLGVGGVAGAVLELVDLLAELASAASSVRHSNPHPAARRCTFAARASAGSVAGMSSSTSAGRSAGPSPRP